MIEYLLIAVILFVFILAYFKIANKYNIIDKPNERSSHSEITLRGGGVIYPVAFLLFIIGFLFQDHVAENLQSFLIFGGGLLTICTISFIDDIVDLSSKIRLLFHFTAVTLLLYFINAFQVLPFWVVPVFYIVIIGTLNAFNFMDGINGITGLYSLVVLGSLLYVNSYVTSFTDQNFIIYPMIASAVFLFFNFRKRAKCFMGDIGSLGISFWILGILGLLVIKTGNYSYVLFLAVYGVEVVLTILERLKLRENIFEAHRRHLYQLFANEKKVDHRFVSLIFAVLQVIISVVVIQFENSPYILFLVILLPLTIFYLILKNSVKKTITDKI